MKKIIIFIILIATIISMIGCTYDDYTITIDDFSLYDAETGQITFTITNNSNNYNCYNIEFSIYKNDKLIDRLYNRVYLESKKSLTRTIYTKPKYDTINGSIVKVTDITIFVK